MFRYIEVSANVPGPRLGTDPLPSLADRDRQLAAISGFGPRHHAERSAWRERIASQLSAHRIFRNI